jgi:hypothetical protein
VEGFGDDVAVRCEAFGYGVLNAAFVQVHDGHDGTTGLPCHGCNEETDSAGSDYQGSGTRCRCSTVQRMDCYREWFQKCGCVEGDMVWDSEIAVSK